MVINEQVKGSAFEAKALDLVGNANAIFGTAARGELAFPRLARWTGSNES